MRLQEIFNKYKGEPKTFIDGMAAEWGGDKGSTHSYILKYEEWFEPIRNKKINLLEIGVMYGASLRMWKEYFEKGNIFGVDIRPHCVKYNEDRILIDLVDVTKEDEVNRFLYGKDLKFDIIIDDGSHQIQDQLHTLELLYPYLNLGGMYIIEDIQNIDQVKFYFDELKNKQGLDVIIEDLRWVKNRYDDILILIRK